MQNLIEVLKIATGTFFGLLAFAGVLHTFIQVKVFRARQDAEDAAEEAAQEIDALLTRYEAAVKADRENQVKTDVPVAAPQQEAEQTQKPSA